MSLPINTCPVDNVAPAGEPRATFMFAAVVLLLVAGSYNSEFVLELLPPANNTFPFNNNVAVCSFRGHIVNDLKSCATVRGKAAINNIATILN
ncbi:unnamed protein product [Adineta ricciae]|uniref:Uncharacterized protein n=1 Tax=Adineta ricciae TaxID=249248 RepID=A0A814Q8S7_ADIRI|nr:unnamed protein product [Adineta ricciae]